jgi:DNA-binding protein HU-beta
MTHREMAAKVAQEANITKAAADRLLDFISRMLLTDLLLEGRATWPGLGIFSVVERAPRQCINPQTGKHLGVKPGHKAVKFKPYKEFKEQIEGKVEVVTAVQPGAVI